MNYINGLPPENMAQTPPQNNFQELVNQMPNPVCHQLVQRINTKIDTMQQNYNLYFRRNRLISAIAILENEVNEIENEINRL